MKTAIITGVSGNLGQAIARKFISEGLQVIGTVAPNTREVINIDSGLFSKEEVDLTKEEDTEALIQKIIQSGKTIDIAVLTVGGFATGDLRSTTSSDILKMVRLNFETAYNVARPVFIHMQKQNYGRIFLLGAKPGANSKISNGMIGYGLSKSLLFRLAEIMNKEAKDQNIVTSVVVPSTIDTPQNRVSMPDADFSKWVKPESIADVIYFHAGLIASVLREPIIKVYGDA